jgi:uncharacterized protein (DUF2147 family)
LQALLIALALQVAENSLVGHWGNKDGSVIVEIHPCGDALCGTVRSASEKARTDARRGGTDDLIGTEVLTDFGPIGAGRWRGILFVPDKDVRSKAEIIQLDSDRLRIRVCAVGEMFCKSQVWQRTTPRLISGSLIRTAYCPKWVGNWTLR